MPSTQRPIILILGPTAGGKTDLSLALARRLPGGGECVCADSMQVYRGMDLGTAKPTHKQRTAVPHHLLDVADPADDSFNVDRWLVLAESAIADIRRRGRWPLVVGGTNLYIQALLKGMCEGPEPDQDFRRTLSCLDTNRLRSWLERIDPAAAGRIHPNDRRRTIRAIEVHEQTGLRLSEMQRQWPAPDIRPDVFIVGLEHPPPAVNARINARVREMFQGGLVQEVEGLLRAGRLGAQARQALGYAQVADHLAGRMPLDEATEQVKIRTRRFAKQQRTWLRRFRRLRPSVWLDATASSPEDLVTKALTSILTVPGQGDGTRSPGPEGRLRPHDRS